MTCITGSPPASPKTSLPSSPNKSAPFRFTCVIWDAISYAGHHRQMRPKGPIFKLEHCFPPRLRLLSSPPSPEVFSLRARFPLVDPRIAAGSEHG